MEVSGQLHTSAAYPRGKSSQYLLDKRWEAGWDPELVGTLWSKRKKGKAIPVTGRGGPWGRDTSRLSHFLDNRLTDGGEVFSLTRRPPFTPRKVPATHFC
jgi:hypothetical protein